MTQKRFVQVDAETGELDRRGVRRIRRAKTSKRVRQEVVCNGTRCSGSAEAGEELGGFPGADGAPGTARLREPDYHESGGDCPRAGHAAAERTAEHQAVDGARRASEGPKIGISRSYRLNPEFGWRGSGKNHIATLDLERKKRMAKAGIKGVIEGGQQAPQEAPERDPNTLDMFTE